MMELQILIKLLCWNLVFPYIINFRFISRKEGKKEKKRKLRNM